MSYGNWKHILAIFSFHNSVFNGISINKTTWRDPLLYSAATFDHLFFFFFLLLLSSLGSVCAFLHLLFFLFPFTLGGFLFFLRCVRFLGFFFFSSSFTGFDLQFFLFSFLFSSSLHKPTCNKIWFYLFYLFLFFLEIFVYKYETWYLIIINRHCIWIWNLIITIFIIIVFYMELLYNYGNY